MGEVYRARDTRLDRTVALKVLPAALKTSVARARFEREARAIAALSHPHICAIHDVGSDDGTEYLVMEFLEGETLAERIARGPLPIQHVLRYGIQIAEALQQAHRAGITHRDLKPGNIMITSGGAKLLDFGLAKSIHEHGVHAGHDAATQISPLTSEGMVVGTFQYMSPEQLEGKPLDHRTDIFSLGVILYEMTTGRRPFAASSSTALAAAILGSDPTPVRAIQPQAPAALERIIVTALEKNPDDRWQTAHDIARQLRWLTESSTAEVPARATSSRRIVAMFIAAIALVGLTTWAVWRFAKPQAERRADVVRLELSAPTEIVPQPAQDVPAFALSPDGRTLCFVGASGGSRALYLRELGSYDVHKVEGSENAAGPFWSSDGAWIGFSARGKLWKTPRSGDAPPRALCDVAIGGAIATWAGNQIYFSDAPDGRREIYRVSADGGTSEVVIRPKTSEWRLTWPYILPGGKRFVYHAFSASTIDHDVILASLDGSERSVLLKNVSVVRAVAHDQLVYVRDAQLLAQRFDADAGQLIGDPVTVAKGVRYFFATGRAEFDTTPAGVIVYRTEVPRDRMLIVDRTGVEKRLLDRESWFFDFSLAPDGSKAAVTVLDRGTRLGDIWLYDIARGVRDRLTSDAGMEFAPLWSRDGTSVYHSNAQGGSVPHVVRRRADGSSPQQVTQPGRFRYAASVSRDGNTLYFMERSARTKTDIYRIRGGVMEPLFVSDFFEEDAELSPDDQWLAYVTDATGRREVYVQNVAGGGERIRVSQNGGVAPRWSGDGAELFYASTDRRSVWVAHSASRRWNDVKTEPLFTTQSAIGDFAAFPDGRAFLMTESVPGPRDGLFHVVTGWR